MGSVCSISGPAMWGADSPWAMSARHDPTWKPGPFISAHPYLASARVLEAILRRESNKTPIRRIHYSTPTEQEILRWCERLFALHVWAQRVTALPAWNRNTRGWLTSADVTCGVRWAQPKADPEQGQSPQTPKLFKYSQALSHEQPIELALVQPETNPPAAPSLSWTDNLWRENEEKGCG